MIHSKISCFENKRNDFAQNYFAESLESNFPLKRKKDYLRKKKDTI